MNTDGLLPSLGVPFSEIAERAMVVGDPKRVEIVAELLQNAKEVGRNREYVTVTGKYKGKRVTVASHGIGSAGASIAFHELFQAGVKIVIRAGSCGGKVPGLIIATGAVRIDGTSENLVPIAYPAVADYRVVYALREAAAANGYPDPPTGIVISRSFLYPGLIEQPREMWLKAGIVAIEMELATLLVMAGIRGLQAGGIFASMGDLAQWKETDEKGYDQSDQTLSKHTKAMLPVALDALVSLG